MGQLPAPNSDVAMQKAQAWNAQRPIVPDQNGNYQPRPDKPFIGPGDVAEETARKWNAQHPMKRDQNGNYIPQPSNLYGGK